MPASLLSRLVRAAAGLRAPRRAAADAPFLMVLTGAGVSAASGVATYRDGGGPGRPSWRGMDARSLASADGFASAPRAVLAFHDERRREMAAAGPNAAHAALAALEAAWPGGFLLATQNIDRLHEQAGSRRVVHMHGSIFEGLCPACGLVFPQEGDMLPDAACPGCGRAPARPNLCWFGERPRRMGEVHAAVDRCDVLLVVGCSLAVRPANLLPSMAWRNNRREPRLGRPVCRVVEVNPTPTRNGAFTEVVAEAAETAVPRIVAELLAAPDGRGGPAA